MFSKTIGARFITDGPCSGQEFRENLLMPKFENLHKGKKLLIDFDGTYGYPPSFIEEAFGGLARIFEPSKVLSGLEFKSDEEPSLIDDVIRCINNAKPSS